MLDFATPLGDYLDALKSYTKVPINVVKSPNTPVEQPYVIESRFVLACNTLFEMAVWTDDSGIPITIS